MPERSSTINATLRYLADIPRYATEKPYRLVKVPMNSDFPTTNMEFVTHSSIPIKDIRKQPDNLNIEANGFQLYNLPGTISMESSYAELVEYCKSMANFVKVELGGLEAFVFDFRVSFLLILTLLDSNIITIPQLKFRSNAELSIPHPATPTRKNQEYGRPSETFLAEPVWVAHCGTSSSE